MTDTALYIYICVTNTLGWQTLNKYVCMYVCLYVCRNMCTLYVCMYACRYICRNMCIFVCMHACMHARMYVGMYVCMFVCVYAYMHTCMYVRTCVGMCVCVCMYVCIFSGHIPHDSSVLLNFPTVKHNVVAYSNFRIFTRNLCTAGNEHTRQQIAGFSSCSGSVSGHRDAHTAH